MLKKVGGKVVAVVAVSGVLVGNAMAALPAGIEAGFTAIGTDGTTAAGYAAVPFMLLLGLVIGFKLTKRFANKI